METNTKYIFHRTDGTFYNFLWDKCAVFNIPMMFYHWPSNYYSQTNRAAIITRTLDVISISAPSGENLTFTQ